MRILLVSNFELTRLGGVEIAVCNVAHQLRQRGYMVEVIANSNKFGRPIGKDLLGNLFHRFFFWVPLTNGNVKIHSLVHCIFRLIVHVPLLCKEFLRFLGFLADFKPDVLNLHFMGETRLLCLVARKLYNFRFVLNIHGEDIEAHVNRSVIGRWLAYKTLMAADRVLSNSHSLLAKAQAICPGIKAKSAIVGNGVTITEFIGTMPFHHSSPYVLSIGRLLYKKGFDILIRSFSLVRDDFPHVSLLIAGGGPEYSVLSELIKELFLSDSVVLLGEVKRSEIPALLAGCEVFVSSSRIESFGIVLLEAMAAKRPVIATRTGGVPEIISHLHNGFLVQPESTQELANALRLLLSNLQLRDILGQEGYFTVQERFEWTEVVDRYIENYALAIRPYNTNR